MNSNVPLSDISNSIRVQYFFMHKLSCTGDLSLTISLDEGFSKLSIFNKVKMVKDFYSLIKPDEELIAESTYPLVAPSVVRVGVSTLINLLLLKSTLAVGAAN